MNLLTDICVNLTNSQFNDDRHQVIERAIEQGVSRMIIAASDIESSLQAIELCEAYPQYLRCTAGCHPHDAKDMTYEKWEMLEALFASPFVVAVGECGLDYNRNFSEPHQQIDVFTKQLQLAEQYDLPVYLHERDAYHEMISILHQYRGRLNKLLIHCFTGDEEQLQGYLELNMYIGITGWICDERRNHGLLESVAMIPDDRIMIETDAPFLLPRSLEQKPANNRCEPTHLHEICRVTAKARDMQPGVLASISTLNSAQFFDWPIDVYSISGR
ncbi:MAG: TatD family hydrolase [Kangiellaceae bacterium]|jgi:TatD DNase family protein|nr:TatD family hydrolase [Kangiellaceae bacterium]